MNDLEENPINVVKDNMVRALLGGFVGTAIFTMMGLFLAPHVIGQVLST